MKPPKRETFLRAADRVVNLRGAPDEETQDDRMGYLCSAHGCPMWGSISDGKRWCRFHFGEGGRHMDAITEALRRNRRLVDEEQRLRAKCASANAGPADRPAMLDAEKALALAVKAVRGVPQ